MIKLLVIIFSILAQVSLIALKLFKVITWSWFLILIPIELYLFFLLLVIFIVGITVMRTLKDFRPFNP